MVKIKEIPLNDRPRERLLIKGCSSLSNEELIAILLKTGTKNDSAKDIANKLLKQITNINELKKINYEQLSKIKGIGKAKATTLLSAIELGSRINSDIEVINNLKVTNSKIIFNYYKNSLGNLNQEHFICLYLDNQKVIIKDKLLFIGTINQTLIHPREIFKEAYLLSASSIICIHNHPSGNILPSKEDIEMTKVLISVGNLLGVKVIDHIIISSQNYYSFFENGDI